MNGSISSIYDESGVDKITWIRADPDTDSKHCNACLKFLCNETLVSKISAVLNSLYKYPCFEP